MPLDARGQQRLTVLTPVPDATTPTRGRRTRDVGHRREASLGRSKQAWGRRSQAPTVAPAVTSRGAPNLACVSAEQGKERGGLGPGADP